MERELTFKIERKFSIDVENFAERIELYFQDIFCDIGLDDDEMEAVEYDNLKLAVAKYWIMKSTEKRC